VQRPSWRRSWRGRRTVRLFRSTTSSYVGLFMNIYDILLRFTLLSSGITQQEIGEDVFTTKNSQIETNIMGKTHS